MKKSIVKPLSIGLCAALLAGAVGTTVYALTTDSREEPSLPASSSAGSDADAGKNDKEMVKDETVYVIAGADGSVQKIIVSDWIKNTLGSASFSDQSELSDVQNVKGDETYTMNGDHMRVWDAQGNDIYYQGNIEKELPVGMSVTYTLNGEAVSPSDLAGKSGRVTIRFEYTNRQYETVEIDGKQEKIYVPFAMLTGILLDNDVFTHVDVSNGKLINDGDRTAVIGLALPGLQDNLGIGEDSVEIPDYVEISADVTHFEMSTTMTIATNELFNKIDPEKLDSIDTLTDSLDELTEAMDQLTDGSSQLYDGLCTLLDKSGELIDGIDALAAGAKQLRDGAGELNQGAAELQGGVDQLAAGLGTLCANNESLNAGSRQVFESLLSMADTQLAAAGLTVPKLTIQNYAATLDGVIASLDQDAVSQQARELALSKVTQAVRAQESAIRAAVTAAVEPEVTQKVQAVVRASVEEQVLAAMGMTKETYEAGIAAGIISEAQQAQIQAAIGQQMDSDAVKATVAENVRAQMQSAEITALIDTKTEEQIQGLIEQNMNSAEVQNQITAALEQAQSGAASISALKAQLNSYRDFYNGLLAYTDGVDSAKDGADALKGGAAQLKTGTDSLYAGIEELYGGVIQLKNGAPALVDGVTALRDGAMKLSDGLQEFNEQGVQKLVDAVDGDLGGLVTRLRATVDVSKNYTSFSGISDDMACQVKFIYRTESVKPAE